ncbi:MAG: InlB B-repeat-containing protein [Treponema sp.]|nr:InlB B-repeat-containing protein [Treponema sp.]
MKHFCGKKGIAAAFLAAAMALFLFFGCSSGGDNGMGEIPNQGGYPGGEQKPDEGENQGEEEPKTFTVTFNANAPQGTQATGTMAAQTVAQGQTLTLTANAFSIAGYVFKGWAEISSTTEWKYADGQKITVSADITLYAVWESETPKPQPKEVKVLLKEIIGDAEYGTILAEMAAGNLTLTAEKIKAVGDYFPALEKDAESGKEAKDVENTATILQNKEAFVAQAEGEVEIKLGVIYPDWYEVYPEYFNEEEAEKKCTVTYKKDFAFEGEFNLDELQFEKMDGAQGNFDNATLTNNGTSITVYELNQIRGSSLPILKFDKTENNIVPSNNPYKDINDGEEVLNLYSDYMYGYLDRIQIKGNMSGTVIDGSKI